MTANAALWIITRKYPPAVGGMEELSYQTSRQLARRRPVTLVSWGRSQAWLPLFAGYAAVRLLAGLLGRRVSVLLLGDPVLAFFAWLAARFRVPVACVVHGLDVTWPNAAYQAYLRSFFCRSMDAYICISRATAEQLRPHGVRPERVFVVPVGVEQRHGAKPAACAGDPLLLLVGRLVPRKGAAWFVREVLPGLTASFPALRLVIVGEGPDRTAIEAAVQERGLSDHVELAGAVGDDAKWSMLARCDAVIVPNVPVQGDVEGFGIVALEAGAAGKPVFAADLEGLQDAVTDGVNGWRLPPQDSAAWQRSLAIHLGDRQQLGVQGALAREHVTRNFNWESIGARYADIVDRLEQMR
jgi:glycosyltransferase involved in cell wall biosynthesis